MRKYILSILLLFVALGQGFAKEVPFTVVCGSVLSGCYAVQSARVEFQGFEPCETDKDGRFCTMTTSANGGKVRVSNPDYWTYYYSSDEEIHNIHLAGVDCGYYYDDGSPSPKCPVRAYEYAFSAEVGLMANREGIKIEIPADVNRSGESKKDRLIVRIASPTRFTNVPPGGWEYEAMGGESVGTIMAFNIVLYSDDESDRKIHLSIASGLESDLPATIMRFDENAFNWDLVTSAGSRNRRYDFELSERNFKKSAWYCCHIFKEPIRKVNLCVKDKSGYGVPNSRFRMKGIRPATILTDEKGKIFFYLPLSCEELNLDFEGCYYSYILGSTINIVNWVIDPDSVCSTSLGFLNSENNEDAWFDISIPDLTVRPDLTVGGERSSQILDDFEEESASTSEKLQNKEDESGNNVLGIIAKVIALVCGLPLLIGFVFYVTKYVLKERPDSRPILIASVLSLHPIFSERQQDLVKKYLGQNTMMGPEQIDNYIQTIRDLGGTKLDLVSAYENVNIEFDFTERRFFMELLFKLAADDDGIKNDEWQLLNEIMVGLKMNKINIEYLTRRYGPLRTEFEEFEQSSYYSNNQGYSSSYSYASSSDYALLGVSAGCSKKEIQQAYHQLALEYHPDLPKNARRYEECERKMAEINLAYDRLMKG